jgi:O-antigen/teichoic acid export membrane protein
VTRLLPTRSAASRDVARGRDYGWGTAVLSLGVGATGIVTYSYFALASHSLSASDYGGITLVWTAVFVSVAVLYRPVEQLLSRTIADRGARGQHGSEHLRIAGVIQIVLGGVFLCLAIALREPVEDALFSGSRSLYWIFVSAVVAYAASYFARGVLAGHRRFGFYGGLMLIESASRFLFAFVVVVGFASGQSIVALGIVVAPIVSLAILPWAVRNRARRMRSVAPSTTGVPIEPDGPVQPSGFTVGEGMGFAFPVLLVMLAEQTFLNGGPLLVKATEGANGAALAGFAFNVILIARAPLQLFQAVQTSILPHLTRLSAGGATAPFRRSVSITIAATTVFAVTVALVMLVAGPRLMDLLFGASFAYGRFGLVVVAIGMGLYLCAATLNQAALAANRASQAAVCWISAASVFVGILVLPVMQDRVLQVELAFLGGAFLLVALLYVIYRRD